MSYCVSSQSVTKDSLMSLPIPIVRLMVQDLVRLDNCNEQVELMDEFINSQTSLINLQDKSIIAYKKKMDVYDDMIRIHTNNELVLNKQIKKLTKKRKTERIIYQAIGIALIGIIITTK